MDRCLRVSADDLHSLGKALGQAYGPAIDAGLRRVEDYYIAREPVTLSQEQWFVYASRLRSACKKHCPATFEFAEGLSEALGRDAFLGLLDFELYTLEMERDAILRSERSVSTVSIGQSLDAAQVGSGGQLKQWQRELR